MAERFDRCGVCGGLIDEEDLFCANCGTEAADRMGRNSKLPAQNSTHNFECKGCGASMSYDASAGNLRCPFCGSEKLDQQQDMNVLAPHQVVPFQFVGDQVMGVLRKWLGNGFWRPGDLASSAVVTKMNQVYVPYWVFEAHTHTFWTADSSRVPLGSRGDWHPMSGAHEGQYAGILIGASAALTPDETSAICPFDLTRSVAPPEVDLQNVIVEQFRVPRKYARPLAREHLEEMERQSCAAYIPDRNRNLKVNVRLTNLASVPVLLPVWILAYRYKSRVFRFLVNGQTGRVTGEAPTSWVKVIGLVVLVLAILGFLALAFG